MRYYLAFIAAYFFFQVQATEWLIIADAPGFPVEQVQSLMSNKKVIALDGVADSFKKYGLVPHIILGDFDSVKSGDYWGIKTTFYQMEVFDQPYEGNFGTLIVPAKNQDLTDLEKGILFADKNGATSIVILNAVGGRMDHTLGNIGILRKYDSPTRSLQLFTSKEIIQFVKDETVTITGKPGDYCAVMGYPEAWMTTQGLTYNGDRYPLILGVQESICNTLAAPEATIEIAGEAIVIGPQ